MLASSNLIYKFGESENNQNTYTSESENNQNTYTISFPKNTKLN